jgi:hypothetical protein
VLQQHILRQLAEQRYPLPQQHGDAGDGQLIHQPLAQETLNQLAAIQVQALCACGLQVLEQRRDRPRVQLDAP